MTLCNKLRNRYDNPRELCSYVQPSMMQRNYGKIYACNIAVLSAEERIYRKRRTRFVQETNTLTLETDEFHAGDEHFSAGNECVENLHLNLRDTKTLAIQATSKQNLSRDDC